LRDVLQLSDRPGDREFLEKLGEVKDAIGEWHDWEELIAMATQLLDHGTSCKLIKHLKDTMPCSPSTGEFSAQVSTRRSA